MPVYSMTGYASAQHSTAHTAPEGEARNQPVTQLGLEVRSVNSRFLDLTFRLPEDLRQFEPALRELLGSKLKRGKGCVYLKRLADVNAGALEQLVTQAFNSKKV